MVMMEEFALVKMMLEKRRAMMPEGQRVYTSSPPRMIEQAIFVRIDCHLL